MVNTFTGDKLIYIPVTTTPNDIKIKYPSSVASSGKDKQCSWWSNNPLLPYNAMLMSAYYGMNKIKDRNEIRDEVLFFGDSGGYQLLQYKLNKLEDKNIPEKLTWKKVINWQMKVCDIGMTLDIPTSRQWNETKNKKIFEDRLKESKKNALSMLEYKNKHIEEAYNPDFRLFNCIHGEFYDDMMRWYKETTDNHNYEYDGFSLSTSSKMKYLLPLRLGFAMEYSVGKPFHILGLSSPNLLPLIAYANKYTNTQIYFDSSSTSFGKRIRKQMYIWDFGGNGIRLKENIEYNGFRGIECTCPICKQLDRPEDLWKLGTISGTLISLHNLYWMTNYTEFISNYVYCNEEFMTYVKNSTGKKLKHDYKSPEMTETNDSSWLLKYIEFLDCVHENGLETAWNKYFMRNEPSDPLLIDESDTENYDILMLNAAYNSKIRDLQKDSTSIAIKACNDMMKKETLNPNTQEIVKVRELVEEDFAEVLASLPKIRQERNVKKVSLYINNC
jgi:tRNA-guanine family transglycosylase